MRACLSRAAVTGLLALSLPIASSAASSPTTVTPGLSLAAVSIEPTTAKADTLCRLRVRIHNAGQQAASHLVFQVQVAGHQLPAYRNLVYLQTLPPGQTTEVRLRNFWSSETDRPFPANGKLTIQVALVEAQWVQVTAQDGATTTEPLGPVANLPAVRAITVKR